MRERLLIVDDMEINRAILAQGFEDIYDIIEAPDGEKALDIINSDINVDAVLLDLIMPKKNGIDVLKDMQESGKLRHIPVFVITSADSEDMLMSAYNLGAADVITKPYMLNFLRCRVSNIIELYKHRNDLEGIVNTQLKKLSGINRSMVELLASIIEFRDCESGEHVRRIANLTEILMTYIGSKFEEYKMPQSEVEKIGISSITHDVGKIAIPDSILNKPARLTKEEFEIMKQHTVKGCEILKRMPDLLDKDIYNYSYDICRYHHERWDGKGYPDGLKGDEIPIWAQVVAIADVYDALTSQRAYKSAYSKEKAIRMILGGECGAFNPKVLEAFVSCVDKVRVSYEG